MGRYYCQVALFFVIFLLCTTNGEAQTINHNWLLGNQWGLDFNTRPPSFFQTPINYDLPTRNNFCVSDTNGKILFYTNTDFTYNQLHQRGDIGWIQSAGLNDTDFIIIPDPGSTNKFYLFNRESRSSSNNYVQFSIYNTAINDGLGGIEPNNHRVFLDNNVTNCFIGAAGPPNTDYNWMITHERGSNVFKAYRITPCGVENPVYSEIGVLVNWFSRFVISSDYSTLAVYSRTYGILNLLKFDQVTGKFSNVIDLGDNFDFGNGMVFSPNNQYLYGDDYQNGLIQLDVSSLERNTIINSAEMIFAYPDKSWYESMRMGPDDKLYITSTTNYFSIIHDPDQKGRDVNFELNALLNPAGKSRSHYLGRNTIPQNTFNPFRTISDTTICSSDSLVLHLTENQNGYYTYEGNKITSPLILKEEGDYEIEYVGSCIYADTFKISVIETSDIITDTFLCGVQDEITIHIDRNEYESLIWDNGDTQFDRLIDKVGTYSLRVEKSGCSFYDTMEVNLVDNTIIPYQDTTLCQDQSLNINETHPVEFFIWSDGYESWQREIDSSGTYKYSFNYNGCHIEDSLRVNFSEFGQEIKDTILCPGEYIVTDQDTIYPGSYYTDTITSLDNCPIIQKIYPVIDSISLVSDTLEVTISSDESYNWYGIEYSIPGTYYHLYYTDNGCEVKDLLVLKSTKVLYFPNVVSANGDGLNDVFTVFGIGLEKIVVEKFQIYDRYGNKVYSQKPGVTLNEVKWDTKEIKDEIVSGVYTFILITYADGNKGVYSGSITLLR